MADILKIGSANKGNFTLKVLRDSSVYYIECNRKDKIGAIKTRLRVALEFSNEANEVGEFGLFWASWDEEMTNVDRSSSKLCEEQETIDSLNLGEEPKLFLCFLNGDEYENIIYKKPLLIRADSEDSDEGESRL